MTKLEFMTAFCMMASNPPVCEQNAAAAWERFRQDPVAYYHNKPPSPKPSELTIMRGGDRENRFIDSKTPGLNVEK